MPTTRRSVNINGTRVAAASTPTQGAQPSAMSSPIPPPSHSPLLPTNTELLLLAVYPLVLAFGSLFALLSPTLRPPNNSSTYSALHQSFQPASEAPSYFAQKRNVFNVYFVKIGWFWCTAAFFAFLAFVGRGTRTPPDASVNKASAQREEQAQRFRRGYQAVSRYLVCTLLWVFVTQWFFGPAIIDRGFSLTGGVCMLAEKEDQKEGAAARAAAAFSHAACKSAEGQWTGGYDISGHVFLLVLGSGMLWFEMLPYLFPRAKGLGVGRVVARADGSVVRIAHLVAGGAAAYDGSAPDPSTLGSYATALALAVAALCWWMLLMTAAFFHTWVEKLSGYLIATAGLWAVYLLPRGFASLRAVLGMPGW